MTEQRWFCPRCRNVVVLRRMLAVHPACFGCVVPMEPACPFDAAGAPCRNAAGHAGDHAVRALDFVAPS